MCYVYFVLVGYRVTIGRTISLYKRMKSYRRTHADVFVLGIIECESKKISVNIERRLLKQFELCNAFRDMFYLTPEMRDWIVENTSPINERILKDKNYREHERNYAREYMRKYRAKNPDFEERGRKYQREYERKKRRNAHNH